MIRKLTFEIVLQNKHNSFHALVTPNQRDQRQQKQTRNNEIDRTNYHVPAMKEQLTIAQKQNKNRKI